MQLDRICMSFTGSKPSPTTDVWDGIKSDTFSLLTKYRQKMKV